MPETFQPSSNKRILLTLSKPLKQADFPSTKDWARAMAQRTMQQLTQSSGSVKASSPKSTPQTKQQMFERGQKETEVFLTLLKTLKAQGKRDLYNSAIKLKYRSGYLPQTEQEAALTSEQLSRLRLKASQSRQGTPLQLPSSETGL
jgi:hypothetical protein